MTKKRCLKSISVFVFVLMCFVLTFAVLQGDVLADDKGTESPSFPLFQRGIKGDSSGYEGYTRIISTLLIVIALIIATAFVLKKKYGVRTNIGRTKKFIKIIDHAPMGVKKSVFLVKVPGKHLLLGVTSDRIQLITKIADEDINVGGEAVNKKEFLNLIKKSFSERKQG